MFRFWNGKGSRGMGGGGLLGLLGLVLLGGCGVSQRAEYEAIRGTIFEPTPVAVADRMTPPRVATTDFGFERLAHLTVAGQVSDSP